MQILNNCFKTKSFATDSEHTNLYMLQKTENKRLYKSKFELYLPDTMSILVDKKIETIRTISKPTLVTFDEKKYNPIYSTDEYTEFYDSYILTGNIPVKYIKGIIIPIEKYIKNPLLFNLFLGKYSLEKYLNGDYAEYEISLMRNAASKSFSIQDRRKYLEGYISALDRMMMDNDIYIPQLIYNDLDPKVLVMR